MQTVFDFEQDKGKLVEIFYHLLIGGSIVSYDEVINTFEGEKWPTPSSHPQYGNLKKIVPQLVKELEYFGFHVQTIKEGKKTYYQYKGTDPNPLVNILRIAHIAKLKSKIELRICQKKAMKINYHPFDRGMQEITFHPHLLLDYNGRSFVFGVSVRSDKPSPKRVTLGLDRIEGEIQKVPSSVSYIKPEPGEYDYLKNLVGVTLESDAKLEHIVLRAHDQYTFGRLVAKPLHHTQRISVGFKSSLNGGTDYGDVTIDVYPNKELVGQILSYGHYLEVLSPKYFRERISTELTKNLKRYEETLIDNPES